MWARRSGTWTNGGHAVDVDFRFLEPPTIGEAMERAGFRTEMRLEGLSYPGEVKTRRGYLVADASPAPGREGRSGKGKYRVTFRHVLTAPHIDHHQRAYRRVGARLSTTPSRYRSPDGHPVGSTCSGPALMNIYALPSCAGNARICRDECTGDGHLPTPGSLRLWFILHVR